MYIAVRTSVLARFITIYRSRLSYLGAIKHAELFDEREKEEKSPANKFALCCSYTVLYNITADIYKYVFNCGPLWPYDGAMNVMFF